MGQLCCCLTRHYVRPLPPPLTTRNGKIIATINFNFMGCMTSDPCQHDVLFTYTDGTTEEAHLDAIDIVRYYRNFLSVNNRHFDYVTPEYIHERVIPIGRM